MGYFSHKPITGQNCAITQINKNVLFVRESYTVYMLIFAQKDAGEYFGTSTITALKTEIHQQ